MNITIKDVAHKAGVSVATVSRVLNDSAIVDEKTRKKVKAAAKELRYTPNALGRSLSTQKTDALGLLLPDLHGEFFSEVIRGSDLAARQHRYHLVVSSSHSNRGEIEAMLQVMRGRVDGLIIMSPHIDAHTLNNNLPRSLPVVLLNCYLHGEPFDALNLDNLTGAKQMVEHLVEHGHTRIAIIKGTEENIDAQERLNGYRAALRDANIELRTEYELRGDFTEASGFEAVKKILLIEPRPTAIFASNDSMAIGALSALRTFGQSIPGDFALAGFDDIPIAQFIKPSLTTVSVQISNLGALAVEQLVDAIKQKNKHTKRQIILPTSLVIRESCGCNRTTPMFRFQQQVSVVAITN